MRILFCGDTFPAASQYLELKLGPHGDEIVICPGDGIRTVLEGVDVVIPLMCSIDAAVMDAGRFRLIQLFGDGAGRRPTLQPTPQIPQSKGPTLA